MLADGTPRHTAFVAETEQALPTSKIVVSPILTNSLTPHSDRFRSSSARHAHRRPSSRPARPATAPTAPRPTHNAGSPGERPARVTRPRSTHARHGLRASCFTGGPAKTLTGQVAPAYVSGRRGKKQSPRRTVGQPKPRASGTQRRWNAKESSRVGTDAFSPSAEAPTRKGHAFQRAAAIGVPMRTTNTTTKAPTGKPRRATPAPYTGRQRNQLLFDSETQADQGLRRSRRPARRSSAARLHSPARALILAELELLAAEVARSALELSRRVEQLHAFAFHVERLEEVQP